MATITRHSAAARAYAASLLDLANEKGGAEAVGQELAELLEALDQDPQFASFLSSPVISTTERQTILDRVLRPRVSPLLANFLGVLNQHGRLGLLGEVASAFAEMLQQQLGRIEVGVTVAQPIDASEQEAVRQQVSRALGKEASIAVSVDESIIGGIVLQVGDKRIDGSVRAQLDQLKRRMLAAK
jgi:F-type H+-transporting ATPase subunit delta